jgi:hypothetical protein
MNALALKQLSRIILLAIAASITWLALWYSLPYPQLIVNLATVSWNG